MGAGQIVHLPEKKSGVKWMMKIMGFIQKRKKRHKVNSTSCGEKKKGVERIVQVI